MGLGIQRVVGESGYACRRPWKPSEPCSQSLRRLPALASRTAFVAPGMPPRAALVRMLTRISASF